MNPPVGCRRYEAAKSEHQRTGGLALRSFMRSMGPPRHIDLVLFYGIISLNFMERQPISVDVWLAEKRLGLPRRLSPEEAVGEIAQGARLIDARLLEQKMADGVIPGAIEVGLNVLEWRCHPESPNRDPRITEGDFKQRLIILCNQGYSSSAAAHRLNQELGMSNVTDVEGGFQAWKAAGLPWEPFREAV